MKERREGTMDDDWHDEEHERNRSSVAYAAPGGLTLHMRSRAGLGSCTHVEPAGVLLDCGTLPRDVRSSFRDVPRARHVFLTHTHIDHAAAAPLYAHYHARAGRAPVFHVPAPALPAFTAFMDAALRMGTNTEDDYADDTAATDAPQYTAVGVRPGDVVRLPAPSPYRVRVFATCHGVPSVGYGLERVTGRTTTGDDDDGDDDGDDDDEAVERLLLYTGDTTIAALARGHEAMLRYAAVVHDCTFLTGRAPARLHGHTAYPQLAPFIATTPHIAWFLQHLSLTNYTRKRQLRLPSPLPPNVTFVGLC